MVWRCWTKPFPNSNDTWNNSMQFITLTDADDDRVILRLDRIICIQAPDRYKKDQLAWCEERGVQSLVGLEGAGGAMLTVKVKESVKQITAFFSRTPA